MLCSSSGGAGVDPVVARLRDRLSGEPDIAAAYLFGSRARGEARSGSDADIALVFADPVPTDALERVERRGLLMDDLQIGAGVPVDVLDFDAVDPRTARIILHDATLLFEHDRSRRLAAEVRQMSLYHDRQPEYEAERRRTLAYFRMDASRDRLHEETYRDR